MSSYYLPTQSYWPTMRTHAETPVSLFTQGGIAACLLGVASGIPVQAVGRLYLGEVLLMAIAPLVVLLLLGLSDQYGRTARTILLAMAASWIGYVISDIVRGTPSIDYLRGWSRWIAMGASFATLAWIGSKNIGYLAAFLIGLAIGTCLTPFAMGGVFGVKLFWKFYAALPAAIILLVVLGRFRPWVSIVGLIGLSVLSVALDSRANALITLLTAAICFLPARRSASRQSIPKPVSKTSMVAAAVGIVVATILALYLVLAIGARYGYAERFRNSNSARLASATVTWSAIQQSPFIGYGSWPRDAALAKQRDKLVAKAKGSAAYRSASQNDLIIAHSQILQGWLEGGLLGLTFFALLGLQLGRLLAWQALVGPYMPLTPLIVLMQLQCAVNLVFSPFSGAQRVYIPATCVFICYVAGKMRDLKLTQGRLSPMFASPRFASAT